MEKKSLKSLQCHEMRLREGDQARALAYPLKDELSELVGRAAVKSVERRRDTFSEACTPRGQPNDGVVYMYLCMPIMAPTHTLNFYSARSLSLKSTSTKMMEIDAENSYTLSGSYITD